MKYFALVVLGSLLLSGCGSSEPAPEKVIGIQDNGVITEDGKPVIVEMPDGQKAVAVGDSASPMPPATTPNTAPSPTSASARSDLDERLKQRKEIDERIASIDNQLATLRKRKTGDIDKDSLVNEQIRQLEIKRDSLLTER